MKSITSSPSAAINSPRPTDEELAAYYAAQEARSFKLLLDEIGNNCYWLFRAICEAVPDSDGTCYIGISSRDEMTAAYVMTAAFPNMRVEWGVGDPHIVVSRPPYHIDGSTIAFKAIQAERERHEMPYKEYLKSEFWQDKRDTIVSAAGYRCQVCNAAGELHVHHRTYERRGHEAPHDLIALCADCHKLFHDHRDLAKDES